ncbi:MAG TPA: aminotransferase class IV [Candidatus Polarisedimenticolia bacterium]|nr:aminotransferase class IV [Candidatus Polarisedimenticolia bacterium]
MEILEGGRSGWAPWIWLNGAVVSGQDARVSVFDHGFLYGDGVFETARSWRGEIFRWARHRERLGRSLTAARMELAFPLTDLDGAIESCLDANGLREARIRLTVTRGEGGPGLEALGDPPSLTVVVAASPWRPLPEGKYRNGVSAIIPRIRQTGRESLDPSLKSISRVHLVLARLEATDRRAHEAILLGDDGEVTEGTVSNVFLVQDGVIRTPSLETGILEGVTREAVLEIARSRARVVEETGLTRRNLEEAEEVFLTNTSWGVLPVTSLEGSSVGNGKPGPTAADLGRLLADLVETECGR